VQSWTYIARHHVYEADALQISSGKEAGCSLFLTADK
jgi:predicted nucleic acid-binding protein